MTITIRSEAPGDEAAVRQVNLAAFPGPEEAEIVDRLRAACSDYTAFVAVDGEGVVGHILFTPVTLEGAGPGGMGLAPMAVVPLRQGEGIGSMLVRHGLAHLKTAGCPFVLVLGHPEYYPRFGFQRASRWSIGCQWEGVPDEALMLLPFDEDVLPAEGGIARYRGEFDQGMDSPGPGSP